MKESYFKLFEQVKNEHKNYVPEQLDSKILIVDFMNTYIRSYIGSPAVNNDGNHVGGITGFLYSIGSAIKTFNPTRCILVSDGQNSAARKRKIYSEYKEKRSVKYNLNRQYDFDDSDENNKSLHRELYILLQYLQHMPMQIISIDSTEADDTIAYLSQEFFNKTSTKIIIMSSDKDFLQLVDDNISVWSPTKKKIYNIDSVFTEYGITCNNFLYYRMLDGDKSDNISGVHGAGLKTIKKYLPFMCEDVETSIDEIIEYSETKYKANKKLKFYENVINSKDILILNKKLMDLHSPNISESNKAIIRHQLNKKIPVLNKPQILSLYINDGLSNAMPDMSLWITLTLSKLNSFANL